MVNVTTASGAGMPREGPPCSEERAVLALALVWECASRGRRVCTDCKATRSWNKRVKVGEGVADEVGS